MSKKNLKVKNIVTVIIMVIINILTIVLLNLAVSKTGDAAAAVHTTSVSFVSLIMVLLEDLVLGASILIRTIRFKVKEKKTVKENVNA